MLATGDTFGRLTVVRQHGRYRNGTPTWVCRCACGGTSVTSEAHLRRGEVVSCGCYSAEKARRSRVQDVVGRRFGRLVVLDRAGVTKNRTATWRCLCECGAEKVVAGHLLRRGTTRSCGCLARENAVRTARANVIADPWLREAHYVRAGANYRGLPFALTAENVMAFLTAPCHYCGQAPIGSPRAPTLRAQNVRIGGIDRKDSGLGYTLENCVSCCGPCNQEKMDRPYDDFIGRTRQRYEHLHATGVI